MALFLFLGYFTCLNLTTLNGRSCNLHEKWWNFSTGLRKMSLQRAPEFFFNIGGSQSSLIHSMNIYWCLWFACSIYLGASSAEKRWNSCSLFLSLPLPLSLSLCVCVLCADKSYEKIKQSKSYPAGCVGVCREQGACFWMKGDQRKPHNENF